MNIELDALTKTTVDHVNSLTILDHNYISCKLSISKNDLISEYESYSRTEVTNKIKSMLDDSLIRDKRNVIFAKDLEHALNTELEAYKSNPEEYKDREEFVVIMQLPKQTNTDKSKAEDLGKQINNTVQKQLEKELRKGGTLSK